VSQPLSADDSPQPAADARPVPSAPPATRLPREEYVEQAYFFRRLLERFPANEPIQELMESIKHEVLATTKLPLAVDFMLAELKHSGGFAGAMARLPHYFTPYQTYLIREAEDDRGRFDMRIAFAILAKEAEYCSQQATPQGEFLFQFETLCRNRLSYDRGLAAMAEDPIYNEAWRQWILTVRRQVGLVDLADLIYVRSAYYKPRRRDLTVADPTLIQPLFGEKEGRIAHANRRKDPLLLFASLQRHLGYPIVPRPKPADETLDLVPQLARRLERMEARLKLLEEEHRGGIDLTRFFAGPPPPGPPAGDARGKS
jgi:hypothetical protein